jgi:hypothetical protein
MMVVFEVHLVPGADASALLSDEIKRSTAAQVMTVSEARKVGFQGVPEEGGKDIRLIAVTKRDAPWIHRTLETTEIVAGFRVHDVD